MSYHWSIHQLTEYLVSVSKPEDPGAAVMVALERAIEALDAELGAVIIDSEVRGSVGFGRQGIPEAFVAAARDHDGVEIPEIGTAHILRAQLKDAPSREQPVRGLADRRAARRGVRRRGGPDAPRDGNRAGAGAAQPADTPGRTLATPACRDPARNPTSDLRSPPADRTARRHHRRRVGATRRMPGRAPA